VPAAVARHVAQQAADLVRLQRPLVPGLVGRQGATHRIDRVAVQPQRGMARSNTPAMLRSASAATLGPFWRAAVASTSRMCMGVSCPTGSGSNLPNTTRCSMFSRRASPRLRR
jgi:hypothetical protein